MCSVVNKAWVYDIYESFHYVLFTFTYLFQILGNWDYFLTWLFLKTFNFTIMDYTALGVSFSTLDIYLKEL